MDLFEYMREQKKETESPLASRLRPTTLDEMVGQQHIIGKDKLLYRAIKADKLSSIILYGPPGTGKTTLAKVIANSTSAEFLQMNATSAGKKDMEDVIAKAKNNMGMFGKKTILFIDEIHRFNKGQQDYLLPFVEDGTIILIGATTENPYFEVNGALLSRSIIFELKSLEKEDIKTLILRAVNDTQKGMGAYHAVIDEDALDFLADISNGDARAALTAVELGILTTERSGDGLIHITFRCFRMYPKRVVKYDKSGDNHYDTVSAFYQKYARIRSGCGSLLFSADAVCGGGYQVYCKKDHDLCLRGCEQCRSDGTRGCNVSGTGGRTYWNAGSADHLSAGGYLCGECAKEQLRRYGDQRGDGDSQKYDDSSGSATFTGRPLQIIIEARSRRRL